MDELDRRILIETIRLGSQDRNEKTFSLNDIAKNLSLSENDILSRFPSRSSLIEKATEMAFTSEMRYLDDLNNRSLSFEAWTNRVLDYFIFHKEETFFVLNFGKGLARASLSGADLQQYHDSMTYWGKRILCYFALSSDEEYFFVWSATFRSFVYAAANIMRGEYLDTPENRKILATLIGHGMNSFMKGPRL